MIRKYKQIVQILAKHNTESLHFFPYSARYFLSFHIVLFFTFPLISLCRIHKITLLSFTHFTFQSILPFIDFSFQISLTREIDMYETNLIENRLIT